MAHLGETEHKLYEIKVWLDGSSVPFVIRGTHYSINDGMLMVNNGTKMRHVFAENKWVSMSIEEIETDLPENLRHFFVENDNP